MAGTGQVAIRLFVSSTFEDFAAERQMLQEGLRDRDGKVLVESPLLRLRRRCQLAGAALEIIDLRWGISAAASRAHETMERCLTEVDRACRTPGPNFLALLGQRYGWVPLPVKVPAADLTALTGAVTNDGGRLLRRWYRREDNLCPAAYLLRDDDDPGLAADEAELRATFAAGRRLLGWDDRLEYGASATEQEIRSALTRCSATDAREQALCYLRTLEGMPPGSAHYSDCDREGIPDRPAEAAQRRLRADVLANPAAATREYRVRWPEYREGTADYLAQLAEDVVADLGCRLDQAIEEVRGHAADAEDQVHADFAASRRQLFRGRARERQVLGDYLESPAAGPLMVTGPGGVGKSALLALVAGFARGAKPFVERYIAITPEASAGGSLAAGIGAELGLGAADDPFELLAAGLPDATAVLLVDGLDLLGEDDEFLRFRWLPAAWPPGLHVVMSSRRPADAQRLARQEPATVQIELGAMAQPEAVSLFDSCLREAGRAVSSAQHATASAAIGRCPLPLFVRILAELAAGWSARDQEVLDVGDLPGIIGYVFDALSADDRHGAVLVAAALRLLAASRFGLADGELLDAMSHDEDVMASFRTRHPDSPRIGYLPYIVWSSLRDDLAPYLAWRAIAGVEVADFFHRELRETAGQRYSGPGKTEQAHAQLAAMFDRQGTDPGGHWVEELRRAAGEITYHLLGAGQTRPFDELTERADYLRAVAGHRAFQAGRSQPQPHPVDDLITQLRRRGRADLAGALMAAGDMLAVRPEAVPQVLQGAGSDVQGPLAIRGVGFRSASPLPPLVNDHGTKVTAAIASSDGAFLATGDDDGKVAWRSTSSCEPLWCHAGHGSWVTALALSPDGAWLVSAGDDGAIMVWDVAAGRREAIRLPARRGMPQASGLVFVDDTHVIAKRNAVAYRCDIESGRVNRLPGNLFVLDAAYPDDNVAFSPGGKWCVESRSGGRSITATDLATGARPLDQQLHDTVASVAVSAAELLLVSTANGLLRYDLRSPQAGPQVAPGPVLTSLSAAETGFVGLHRQGRRVIRIDEKLAVSVIADLQVDTYKSARFVRYLDPGRLAVCYDTGQVEVRACSDGGTLSSSRSALRLCGGAIAEDGAQALGWLASRTEVVTSGLGCPPAVETTCHHRSVVGAAAIGNGQLVTVDGQETMVAWRDGKAESSRVTAEPVEVSAVAEWRGEAGIAVGSADCRVQCIGPTSAEVDIRSSRRSGRVAVKALDAAGNPPQVAAVLQSGLVAWVHDGEVSWWPAHPEVTVPGTAVTLLPEGVSDGSELGRVRVWGQDRDEPVLAWDAYRGPVAWIGLIGDFMASAGTAGTMFVVNVSTAEVVGALHLVGGIAAVRILSASEMAVLRRDGYLVSYRLEFAL